MMPMSMGDKRIYMTHCSFCRHLLLPDGYHCRLGLKPDDACVSFDPVESVTARVNELFGKLPDGAGAEFRTEDPDA
jgi:hypothetical protein